MGINHSNKTIIITGASKGIGFHLAKRFLSEGYCVVGISRSECDLSDDKFKHVKLDLTDLDEVSRIGEKVNLDNVFGLINNAGMHGELEPFEKNDMKVWIKTFQVNLFGGAALAQQCIPSLRKNRGFMIFLSGGGSACAKKNFSAYGTSKTAVVRFAENLAEELAPDVFVYCIAPGCNKTDMLQNAINHGDKIRDDQIVGFEYPENLCVFLASNKDIRYSGKFIHVMNPYKEWAAKDLEHEMYKLRRTRPE